VSNASNQAPTERTERLVPFLEKALDAIVLYDGEFRMIEVNHAACQLFKKPAAELLGRSNRELFGRSARVIEPWIEKVLTTGRSTQVMHELVIDGVPIAFDTCYSRIVDPRTGESIVFAICRDLAVTALERKHFQEALERQQRALEELNSIGANSALSLEQKALKLLSLGCVYLGMPLGLVAQVDGDRYTVKYGHGEGAPETGVVYSLEETYCQRTLQSTEPVLLNFVKHSPMAQHPCYHRFRLEAYAGAPIIVHARPWGTIHFSSLQPRQPFLSSEAEFLKLLADWIGHELTRHRDETRLRRLLKQKSDLVRLVAHNVRNPVGSIHALSELLLENFPRTQSTLFSSSNHELIGDMKQASEEVLRGLDEILASRLGDAEEIAAEMARHRISEVFSVIRARNAGRALRKRIVLDFQSAEGATGFFDFALTVEAIDNLVNNAVKFSPPDTRVQVSARCDSKGLSFLVGDEGPGFYDTDFPFIFDGSRELSAKSTGGEVSHRLGLSLVKQLIEVQRGTVAVLSKPGEGAKILITLPPEPS